MMPDLKETSGTLVVAYLLLLVALPSQAATITVTNTDDSGAGSLRQAVVDAQHGDKIQFHPSLDRHPIVLTSGPLELSERNRDLKISGRGQDKTIIEGSIRVWSLSSEVELLDLTIVNDGVGWGVETEHVTLRITRCSIHGHEAGVVFRGTDGGLDLHIRDSTIRDNGVGVLMVAAPSRTRIERTSVINNSDYGLWCEGFGSGKGSRGTISRSTIRDNAVGIRWNDCGPRRAPLTVTHTTISRNAGTDSWAWGSGLVFADSSSSVMLEHSTISADASAIGPVIHATTRVILKNSIVVGQHSDGNCTAHSITSEGHNLSNDGSCNLTHPTDLTFTDPMLMPLSDNGGPTWTHALRPNSPAIDAGSCLGTRIDQRGMRRPVDVHEILNVDDGCDIGSFEYQRPHATPIYDLLLILIGGDHDLVAPLQDAIQIMERGDPSDDGDAVFHLQAFIAEVEEQRGWTLTDAEANELIGKAQRIIALLSFGTSGGTGWSQQ